MSEPIFHHYVPRFYLSRFIDNGGFIWIYDKLKDNIFTSKPDNIAGVNKFYQLDELVDYELDPLTLEHQFADLEYQVSNILNCWDNQFNKSDKLDIPDVNRELISLYIVTQLLRTIEAREQLIQFTKATIKNYDADKDSNNLHANLLWKDDLVFSMAKRIQECIWIFGKNNTDTPFLTSDHPVLIKTLDNKQWVLGPRIFDFGMYVVFPISTKLVLYCKDPEYWKKLKVFNNSISPVEFDKDMINHENSGQIGMSYRFIFSPSKDFDFTKYFLSLYPDFKYPKRARYE